MEKLEDVLMQVESLRRDLNAEIVIQEGTEGHYEDREVYDILSYTWWIEPGGYVEGEPRIAKPDTEKQETARKRLQETYNSCDWYSARYLAGNALGINSEILNKETDNWILDLKKRVQLSTTETVEVKSTERRFLYDDYSKDTITSNDYEDVEVTSQKSVDILENLDSKTRAREDLKYFYYNLPDKDMRKKAGKSLGYSSLRIWARENPDTINIGLAILASASGLGYLAYQFSIK
ncbi:Uncharacterised protein [uncultured archaeon]|nr:Uncharacterised protein [uncultured archaeon]